MNQIDIGQLNTSAQTREKEIKFSNLSVRPCYQLFFYLRADGHVAAAAAAAEPTQCHFLGFFFKPTRRVFSCFEKGHLVCLLASPETFGNNSSGGSQEEPAFSFLHSTLYVYCFLFPLSPFPFRNLVFLLLLLIALLLFPSRALFRLKMRFFTSLSKG